MVSMRYVVWRGDAFNLRSQDARCSSHYYMCVRSHDALQGTVLAGAQFKVNVVLELHTCTVMSHFIEVLHAGAMNFGHTRF